MITKTELILLFEEFLDENSLWRDFSEFIASKGFTTEKIDNFIDKIRNDD